MMNSPVKDPRSLTKERLKSELSGRNISLPPADSKKDIYVDLYREHILAPITSSSRKFPGEVDRKVARSARLDALSSDEEEMTDTSVLPKKTQMTNGETDPIHADEVDGLADDDLYMALARRGETVGPIVDSTRRVYQKKLKRILTAETEATVDYTNGHTEDNGHDEEFSDQEDEDEPMETEIIPPYTEPVPEPPRPQRQREPTKAVSEQRPSMFVTRQEPVPRTAFAMEQHVLPPSDDRPTITHRSVHKSFRTRSDEGKTLREEEIVTQADEVSEQTLASIDTHHKQLQKRQGLSVWLQVFIIAVCAVVVFLVLSNMEPAYSPPFEEIAEAQTV